jgi:hypothetical protein
MLYSKLLSLGNKKNQRFIWLFARLLVTLHPLFVAPMPEA